MAPTPKVNATPDSPTYATAADALQAAQDLLRADIEARAYQNGYSQGKADAEADLKEKIQTALGD